MGKTTPGDDVLWSRLERSLKSICKPREYRYATSICMRRYIVLVDHTYAVAFVCLSDKDDII